MDVNAKKDDTMDILLIPPKIITPTNTAMIIDITTVYMLYEPIPGIVMGVAPSLLKKSFIARLIPLTCVNVPIPNSPTHVLKNANILLQ